ncbi:uncharacterized protein LOC129914873 [Episyrphus balteatus]|uniref:uncharacterized protein LOC129914873 n=1 Tax=Episyrphus balteatus TaxID=286459 RepID=UPI0024865B90|nr:uncharacterized protein LOC129914873 [Episyrphus balteatus]
MDKNHVEQLKSILKTIEKHPNAKVSKLIKCFEIERTPQNIALLLIELAEHPEFSADTTISLKYYLDCFKDLAQEPSFAEAGIILFNSSKIYAKRVDHIHQEIERLILSLSNVEETALNPNANNALQNPVKEKRGRKRTLEQINGPYEANMSAKRIKMLSKNKRFENAAVPKGNSTLKKTAVNDIDKTMKTYIPQATWQHSIIEDFDYEDEVDSKKNYKLFTYHLEHRYNTLIPDINFKMYFKIKDYIDDNCNDLKLPESWPPLSDAYIEQYLNLEDAILVKEGHFEKCQEKLDGPSFEALARSFLNKSKDGSLKKTLSIPDSGIESDLNSSFNDTDDHIQANCSENASTQLVGASQISICESNNSARNSSSDSGIDLDTSSVLSQLTDAAQISNGNILDKTNLNSDSGINLETSVESQITDTTQISNEDLLKKIALEPESEKACTETITDFLAPISAENGIQANGETVEVTQNDPTLANVVLLEKNDESLDKMNNNEQSPLTDSSAQTKEQQIQINGGNTNLTKTDPTLLDPSKLEEDLSTLKLVLPHISDEAIYMSDLDEKDRQMLSPSVVTTDVFRCLKDKSNIVIKVDDTIEHLFKIKEPVQEFCSLPLYERPDFSLLLNILKIPLKHFNKRRRFKLGPDFDLLKKERLKKYVRRSSISKCSAPKKLTRMIENVRAEHISPPSTPSYEPDWLGFPEESLMDKNRTMSRDSGISLHQNEDFVESPDLLSSTLNTIAFDDVSNENKNNGDSSTNMSGDLLPVPNELQENTESSKQLPAELPAVLNEPKENTDSTNMPAELPAVSNGSQENTESTIVPAELPVSLETVSVTPPETNNPSETGEVINNINENINNSLEDHQNKQLDDLNEENRIRAKVHQWHSHLQPILACSRERHHFDVFAIGTEIMTQFDRNDVCNEKVSFKNVMEEKDESLISRYFLSMLLLANQGNIRIDVQNKSTDQPSELHDIRLQLLSRKRNIVSLEDNIGLKTPLASATPQINNESSAVAIVRTLKIVPQVPKMDDLDSGVAMSEEFSG